MENSNAMIIHTIQHSSSALRSPIVVIMQADQSFSQWLNAILSYRTEMFAKEIPDFLEGRGKIQDI